MNINENVDVVVNPEYGSAGGTYYPSSIGHNATSEAIGVGATPWWAPAPYLGQNPLANEPFSSFGPSLAVLNASGVALSSGPVVVKNPTVTAPDGGNTSFFGRAGLLIPATLRSRASPRPVPTYRKTCRAFSVRRRRRPTPRPWQL